jgi:hypothetical protein
VQACQAGLVSQVFWPTNMMQEVIPRVQSIALQSAKVFANIFQLKDVAYASLFLLVDTAV